MTSHGIEAGTEARRLGGANAALALLMLAAFLSFLDRQILTLLVSPVQAELHIGDVEIGVLQGFSFAVFFGVMAMPLGWLADRLHRWRLLAAGIGVWSLATVFSGLAVNYPQLLGARMLVGVGEASLMPAAYSLLSDYFPSERRGRAFGIFSLAAFVGGGGSLLAGGLLLHALGAASLVTVPVLGELPVWRATFVLVGTPGLLAAGVLALLTDPPRGGAKTPGGEGAGAFVRYVREHARVFGLVWAAYIVLVFANYTFIPWAPVLIARRFGLAPGSVGMLVGVLQISSGALACLAGGYVADRWTRAAVTGGKFRLPVVMCLGALPSFALFAFAGSLPLAAVGFVLATFFTTFGYVSAGAAIQDMVPAPLRGQTTALWYMATGVIGVGGGPYLTARISEALSASGDRLGLAILLAGAPALLLGLGLTLMGLRPYDALRRRVSEDLAKDS